MTVSFPIYVYTAAKNIEEWLNPQPQWKRIHRISDNLQHITDALALTILFAVILGAIIPTITTLMSIVAIAAVIALFMVILYSASPDSKREKVKLQSFGGECHFLPEGIHVLSHKKENEIGCNYQQIKNLLFCYKEFEGEKILVIKWQYEGKDYQYMLKVDKREKELVALLSFLYAEKIPFQEIDERGKKTYLLDLKIAKDKETEAYQALIDENGKEDK